MKIQLASLALMGAVLGAAPASAEGVDLWRVSGKVAGVAFVMDCRFEPPAAQFGGACTEVSRSNGGGQAGAVHKLTRGAVTGNQISWTYQTSFLISRFDVTFTGLLDGGHMAGAVDAAGRKGDFTGVKN